MIPAVDDFNRAVFLSVCKEFIVGTFQGNSVMFLFFHQLFFHCHFNLCQILNNFVQFINLSNIGRSKRNQSIHASTNRIHQSIDWSGQIGNHKEHDNDTNRSTDQNGCQNSLIQLISKRKQRIFRNKTTQNPVSVFIWNVTTIQFHSRYCTVNSLGTY